jgi:hypothetical protein
MNRFRFEAGPPFRFDVGHHSEMKPATRAVEGSARLLPANQHADPWADTTTAHGRLILTVLGGLAEFERELILTRSVPRRDRFLRSFAYRSRRGAELVAEASAEVGAVVEAP